MADVLGWQPWHMNRLKLHQFLAGLDYFQKLTER